VAHNNILFRGVRQFRYTATFKGGNTAPEMAAELRVCDLISRLTILATIFSLCYEIGTIIYTAWNWIVAGFFGNLAIWKFMALGPNSKIVCISNKRHDPATP
jgi:hypothetical protein